MREGAEAFRGRWDADLIEQLERAPRRSARPPPSCTLIASVSWKATVKQGVERGHRLLEDHRHVLADDPAPRAGRQAQEILAAEGQPVGADPGDPGQKAHDREHQHALARTGFADDRDHVALVDLEIDPVDRLERPAEGRELDREIADLEQRHGGQPRPPDLPTAARPMCPPASGNAGAATLARGHHRWSGRSWPDGSSPP